ncbi:MAG: type IV secretion system DNA-binding domain-containing protein, partial [Candidatus Moranbacteria bacterium]|nr:type IV secretion system DNA-binding domain-containing protein [Candidatus Moranbacteria bacterium]
MTSIVILLVGGSVLFGIIALTSGVLLVLRSVLGFREQINRSMNVDIEIVRVAKSEKNEQEQQQPDAWKGEIGAMEQLLTTLANIKDKRSWWQRLLYDAPLLSFEIANPSNSEEIFFYVGFPRKYRETIEKQIHSFFPEAAIERVEDYTIFTAECETSVSILSLKNTHALPIWTYEEMDVDPLNEISNALSKLNTVEEGGALQIILRPAPTGWRTAGKSMAHKMQQGKRLKDVHNPSALGKVLKASESAMKEMSKNPNKPSMSEQEKMVQLTPEEQDLVKAIEQKSRKAGFIANIRLVATAQTRERADEIIAQLENAFSQFEYTDVNMFKVKKRIKEKKTVFNYIFRNFNEEHTCVLNTQEVASIFHFPISTTETPKIKWLKAGAAPPPPHIPKEGLKLGYNTYRGTKTDIRITQSDRRRHMYVIGQTGVGKSNFLQELAKQDVKNGNGVCFIDPHGDAIEDILTAVPKERAEDVIIFDPADTERPFGLNMLEYEKPEQKTFVINELINIFDKLYDLEKTGGPMFEQYARNAMLLIMDDPESGSTLMEIPKVLADEEFRRMKLSKCKNKVVVDFWTKEAEKAGGEAALANMVPYITSKLTTFIANDMMRPIIAQQESTINFRKVMDEKKILLVNLSKGKVGEINSHLLGMVIVGKILMAALARVDTPEKDREDFHLYIDEFQNVTTDSIAQILSEARKYRLVLTIAHQFIGQLSEDISKAVFGNIGSLCAFRVGPEDAEFLEKQFAPVFAAKDLLNVDNYNCFMRLLVNNESTRPFNMATYPPTSGDQEVANALKELSRLKYG